MKPSKASPEQIRKLEEVLSSLSGRNTAKIFDILEDIYDHGQDIPRDVEKHFHEIELGYRKARMGVRGLIDQLK